MKELALFVALLLAGWLFFQGILNWGLVQTCWYTIALFTVCFLGFRCDKHKGD